MINFPDALTEIQSVTVNSSIDDSEFDHTIGKLISPQKSFRLPYDKTTKVLEQISKVPKMIFKFDKHSPKKQLKFKIPERQSFKLSKPKESKLNKETNIMKQSSIRESQKSKLQIELKDKF